METLASVFKFRDPLNTLLDKHVCLGVRDGIVAIIT